MQTVFEDISPKGGPEETETFMYDPPAEAEGLGSIAVFIDTSTLPDALQYFGALIAGAFRRTYYIGNKHMQRSFAEALRSVNDTLAEEAKSGTGQWIGMLRALIVTTDGKALIMATTGGIEAHLTRQGQTIEIPLEAGEGTRPFGSYTEGELRPKDVLLITRRGTADAHNLLPLLSANTSKAVRQLRKGGSPALMMQANGESGRSEARRNRRSGGSSVYRAALSSFFTILRRLLLGTKDGVFMLMSGAKNGIQQLLARRAEQATPSDVPETGEEADSDAENSAAEQPEHMAQGVLSGLAIPKMNLPTVQLPHVGGSLKSLLSMRNALAAALALLLIGGGIFYFSARSEQAQNHEQIASALAAAQEALERGETQVILGDTEAAVDAFSQGLFILEEVDGADMLRNELLERRNALQGILVAPATTLLSFSGFPVGIEAAFLAATTYEGADNPLALAGSSHPAVWLNDSPKPTDGTFAVLPLSFRTGILDLEVTNEGVYAVLTGEGVALISAQSRSVAREVVDPENPYRLMGMDETSSFLLAEDHTIDLLTLPDPEDDENTAETSPWLIYADSRLEAATDMISVGGEPYVLLNDNTFLRFRRGRSTIRYTIEGFDWDGSASAFAPFGEEQLLVLDSANGRILLCKLNGDIIEQYLLPEAGTYLDMTPGNSENSVLVLTDENVLMLELPTAAPAEEG